MQPSMKLTTKEAAKYLRVGVSTLARWRDEGRGPAFITYFGDRGGRTIRYELWALDAFVAKNRKEPRGPWFKSMPRYQCLRFHIKEIGGFFYIIHVPSGAPAELLGQSRRGNSHSLRQILLRGLSNGDKNLHVVCNAILKAQLLLLRL